MPSFDIVRKTEPEKTFRVASAMGKFDLQSKNIEERFKGSIELPDVWDIGLIVGKSGTGKTTIAKELFPKAYVTSFKYSAKSILDDMPKDASMDEITKTFNAVGFSSPPSWLKPYSVLSNGEKMRVDLAMAILSKNKLFVFDEFTSVVDRQVAKVGSFAMQKAIRKTKSNSENKKQFGKQKAIHSRYLSFRCGRLVAPGLGFRNRYDDFPVISKKKSSKPQVQNLPNVRQKLLVENVW